MAWGPCRRLVGPGLAGDWFVLPSIGWAGGREGLGHRRRRGLHVIGAVDHNKERFEWFLGLKNHQFPVFVGGISDSF